MTNEIIANILRNIGIYLEMKNISFKPRAYEKAAEFIKGVNIQLSEVYKRGGLKALVDLPAIGVSIAEHIEELLKTGHLKYYEQLKRKTPVNLGELSSIEGLGPQSIKTLYKELKIRNLVDLKKAAMAGKIRKLDGFGEKSEENILKSIEFFEKSSDKFILGYAMPEIRRIELRLNSLNGVKKAIIAGSVRRRKETIRDIDILVVSDKPAIVMDYFVSMSEVARVYAHGGTKSAVKLKNGLDADIRVVSEESYGSALNYFTGSKDHNVELRKIAIKKGYKLNEYGLFKGKKQIAGRTEEELYKALGLKYIEPELREMRGEIKVALLRQSADQGKPNGLPELINYGDLKGDLHVHSNWTDGVNSIEEMALAALKNGLEYIVIADHSHHLKIANGLDEKRLKEQWKAIDKINKGFRVKGLGFRVLKGTECDILKDGSMDFPDRILSQFNVVDASVHSSFNLSEKDQTERIKKAMRNKNVDIISHPTGRLINEREAYKVNIEEIIKIAKETGTILEINSFPNRLDLKDEHIKKCLEVGVKMSIDSDGHSAEHFKYLEYGVAQARRGWAEKKDIINAWPLEKMLKLLK